MACYAVMTRSAKAPKPAPGRNARGSRGVNAMRWRRQGLVFRPDGLCEWARHSALQPTPIALGPVLRVYCGMRDDDGRSSVGFVDLDAADPLRVVRVSAVPALGPGTPDAWDRHGVVPCAVVGDHGRLRLYYAGYRRGADARPRFQVYSGLAESRDGGVTFERVTQVLFPCPEAALFRVIHSIRWEDGRWRAWYGAGSRFRSGASKSLPVYDIRYFESADGIAFPDIGKVCVPVSGPEHRVGRPYVVGDPRRGYEMFFGASTMDSAYRLAHATSDDGERWRRRDAILGLDLSPEGWDSEMMAYPAVVDLHGRRWLFYNGNDYGRAGFGCAELITEEAGDA